jgi:hypothetical protein
MRFGCRGVAEKCDGFQSLQSAHQEREAPLFDKFNINSPIFWPNELRSSSYVAVPCHNKEKLLLGHLRIAWTKQMNPCAANRNIFQTAFDRPRSIAPYNMESNDRLKLTRFLALFSLAISVFVRNRRAGLEITPAKHAREYQEHQYHRCTHQHRINRHHDLR